MLFLQYPPCTTCKKAKAWLDTHGIAYEARHIKEQNPSYEELSQWLKISGLQYKALNLKDKLPGMTVEEQLRLLATDGMLVKRPIVVTDDGKVLTGFKVAEWESALLQQ